MFLVQFNQSDFPHFDVFQFVVNLNDLNLLDHFAINFDLALVFLEAMKTC